MDIKAYMQTVGQQARAASRLMAKADTNAKNKALTAMASAIQRDAAKLIAANAKDLAEAREAGLEEALLDRLTLTEKGVAGMAEGLLQIAALPDPVGEITDLNYRPSGIQVGKMRVPLGVIGIIYEVAPQRHGGCRRAVPEVRQCGDPARRLGSDPFQPGDRRLRARRAGSGRLAGDGGAGDRNHRPRRGGRADHHEGISST